MLDSHSNSNYPLLTEIDSLQYIRDPYRLTVGGKIQLSFQSSHCLQSYLPVQLSRKYRPFSAPRSSRDLEQAPGPPSSVARQGDFFLTSDINPLSEVNNAKLLCRFLTPLGKIRTRASTGLTQKSQRRLGKAIRRAREMGIIPYMSRNRSIPNHT
jgi:ribosomal protein S18